MNEHKPVEELHDVLHHFCTQRCVLHGLRQERSLLLLLRGGSFFSCDDDAWAAGDGTGGGGGREDRSGGLEVHHGLLQKR
jgi:hypothetical protein